MNRRYEILDVLGSGGMATVWRARDTELDRIVAIKRPHPAPDGSAVHERFRREGRAAAMVSHPNVVTVHDVGTDDDGPYLVMEFVDAGSLAEIEWSRAKAVSIGTDIAEALAALHAAGIVHRDVKPANILVSEGGAMLTDFGIARAGDDAALTQEGTTFATPAYAAPEVIARGDHTPASDVYALAAVVREMILGGRVEPSTDTQVLIADDLWGPTLDRALSARAEERPSAAAFADELRALPVAATLPPTASHRVGDAVVPAVRPDVSLPDDGRAAARAISASSDRRWTPVVAVALAAILVVAALVLALRRTAGDDDVANTQPSSTDAIANTEAPLVTEAPSPAATAAPTVPPTVPPTEAPEAAPVTDTPAATVPATQLEQSEDPEDPEEIRNDLDVLVSNLSDDVLKSKEGEKLIEDIDKAIEEARDGDIEKATNQIEDAMDRIDDHIDDADAAESATGLVRRLAARLGVDIDRQDGRNDGEDDGDDD